jgi:hypothetical protein
MTALMIELAPDHSYHPLSAMSLIQLEGTLTAANLLLDAWRTNTRCDSLTRLERPRANPPLA